MKNAENSCVRHIRFSKKLLERLVKEAEKNGRTLRGEIEFRLNDSFKK